MKKKVYNFVNARNTTPTSWPQQKAVIKGAIRKVFRMSPIIKYVIDKSRVELPPLPTKNNTPGKRKRVFFKCNVCNKLMPRKFVQVDHIDPVIPLNKTEQEMSYDEIVSRIFCDISNLQVICATPLKFNNKLPSCHKQKTDEENYIRKYITERRSEGQDLHTMILNAKQAYAQYKASKVNKGKRK